MSNIDNDAFKKAAEEFGLKILTPEEIERDENEFRSIVDGLVDRDDRNSVCLYLRNIAENRDKLDRCITYLKQEIGTVIFEDLVKAFARMK